jgi:hypothetical protein
MINGFLNKSYITDIPKKTMNKMIGRYKQKVGEFRKNHTWHTSEGVKRISESKQGTMPVVDSITGDKIGSVPTNHPNVLSGKWVHHSSGKVSVTDLDGNKKYISSVEYQNNKDIYKPNSGDTNGIKNPRYSGITDAQLVDYLIEFSTKVGVGYLIGWPRVNSFYREKYNIPMPKHFSSFRFNGGGIGELYRIASEISGLKINKYPRGILNKKIKENINKLLQE